MEETKGLGFYGNEFFTVKTKLNIISESITRILMTNPGERVGRPFFGVGLKNRVFEPMDEVTIQNLKEQIAEQINQYEPRADLSSVDIALDEPNNTITIQIKFRQKGDVQSEEGFINLPFELEV